MSNVKSVHKFLSYLTVSVCIYVERSVLTISALYKKMEQFLFPIQIVFLLTHER